MVQYEKPKELEELKEKKKRKAEERKRVGEVIQKKSKMTICKKLLQMGRIHAAER